MKNYYAILIALLLIGNAYGQKNAVNWTVEYSRSKTFIENSGQFDHYENEQTGTIHYAVDFGFSKIFFGEKGVSYSFREVLKKSKEERSAIMKQPVKSFEDHKQKEKLMGKFMVRADEVNMQWIEPNADVLLVGEDMTSDYHSYTYTNEQGETVNVNEVKAYRKLIYKNIYPNIDIEYQVHPEIGIKYAYIVHPGADLSLLDMLFDREFSLENDEVHINTLFGDIIDHAPVTFYEDNHEMYIDSRYKRNGKNLSFELGNFDATKTIIIDPWVQTPNDPNSNWDCVWELDKDATGNVYVIAGIMPMQLLKYNSAGTLQWTHNTPYDTTAWLGTMATDNLGNTYVTNGTDYMIQKINTSGGLVWNNNNPSGGNISTEFWNISFNCDQTKLLIGGTGGNLDIHGRVYDIDMNSGNINTSVQVTQDGDLFSIPPNIQEVRAMCPAPNGKYYFLTLDTIGYLSDNLTLCPGGSSSLVMDDHGVGWGYKCENWRYNNTGIKAIRADANFVYVNKGNQLQKRSLQDFSLIGSVSIPGGTLQSVFLGGNVSHNAGIDIDDCGNIYVGSTNGVYKFDSNLNQLASYPTSFKVYDVRVSPTGDIIACGGTGTSSDNNRSGGVQSFAAGACATLAFTCCDASVCIPDDMCESDAPVTLTTASSGGTWSGTGVSPLGVFDPAIAGSGTHTITYTLPCGSESISITVDPCATIDICEEANGDLTASGGDGNYTWYEATITPVSTSIGTEQECIDCPTASPEYDPFFGFYIGCSQSTCNTTDTTWTQYATGVTTSAPSSYPIQITDGNGTTTIINSAGELVACAGNPCSGVTITMNIVSQTDVTCFGDNDGTATVDATGGTAPYSYVWTPGSLTGPSQSGLAGGTYSIAIQDNVGCTGSGSVTINEPAPIPPVATAVSNPTSCGASDGIIEICGLTTSFTYDNLTYDNGSGTVNVGSFTTDGSGCYQITGLAADTYSNFVVTEGACSGSDAGPITLTEPGSPSPTASLVSNPSGCGAADGIIEVCGLNASTTYDNLAYNDGSGTINVGSFTSNASGCYQITGLVADNYSSFTVTLGSCSGTDPGPVSLSDPGSPAPVASLVSNPSGCAASDGIIQLCGLNASTTYDNLNYDNGSGTIVYGTFTTDGAGCFQITGLPADSYSNFVVTLSGCTGSASGPVALTDPAGPSFTASIVSDPTSCGANDGIIEICGLTASTSYDDLSYDNGTGTVIVGSFTSNGSGCYQITGLSADNYSNFVVTQGGCSGSDAGPLTLNDPSAPVVTASVVADPTSCGASDGIIEICGLAASTSYDNLTYDNGAGTVIVGPFTSNGSGCYQITGLTADIYSNFVVMQGGCSGSDAGPLSLNDPAAPVFTATVVADPTTCGASDGIIEICGLAASTSYDNLTYDDGTGTVIVGPFTSDGSGCYQITGLSADTYSNFVVTLAGCSGSYAGPLTLNNNSLPPFTVNIVSNPTGCGNSDGVIEICGLASSTTYGDLTYDNTSGTITFGGFTTNASGCFQITGLAADTYSNFVITDNGCTGSNNSPVSLSAAGGPTTTIVATTDVSCAGGSDGSATAQVSGGTAPYTYAWSPSGGNSDVATNLSAGNYTVTVTDNAGCISTASVTITQPTTITLTEIIVNEDCGDSNGSVSLTVSGGTGSMSYLWTPNGETTSSITGLSGGTYGVTVTDDNGCTVTDSYTVQTVGSLPVIATPSLTTIEAGQSVQLNASGADTYSWSPTAGLDCTTCPDPIASPTNTTMYVVTGTDSSGCSGSDTVLIVVEMTCGEIYVPNIFSPNGYGHPENDKLCVYGNCISDLRFRIFNRWGEMVFETIDPTLSECWDGTYKNKQMMTGVYVYTLYVELFNGDVIEKSGNITLAR